MAELLDGDDGPVIPPTEIDLDFDAFIRRLEDVAEVVRRAAEQMETSASAMGAAAESMLRAARTMPSHMTHDPH